MSAQPYEKILINGDEYWMITHPMDAWLKAHNIEFKMWHTGNHWGYMANWQIINDELWLIAFWGGVSPLRISLKTFRYNYPGYTVEKLFDGKNRVKADWYSGTLEIRYGNCLLRTNYGYAQIYEFELWIDIQKGNVVSKRYFDNREFYQSLVSTFDSIDRNEKGPLYDLYSYYKEMRELYYSGKIDAKLRKLQND